MRLIRSQQRAKSRIHSNIDNNAHQFNDNEKLLVRNEEEYTSPISKIYKSDDEYIILTENSIYLVSAYIPSRRIS